MGYSRKKSKNGRRRMRNSFRKNKSKKGGCSCRKKRMSKSRKLYGGDCTTTMGDLNKPIFDYTTSDLPYGVV
jgi:hypothetical protein